MRLLHVPVRPPRCSSYSQLLTSWGAHQAHMFAWALNLDCVYLVLSELLRLGGPPRENLPRLHHPLAS